MNGVVTRHFLRRRFWIATLLLLATLATSAGTVILVLRAQAERSNYIVAFHHLDNAAMQLELALAHLSFSRGGDAAVHAKNREAARVAFIELLTEFRAISFSDTDRPAPTGDGAAILEQDDHLAGLGEEFGIDAEQAALSRKLSPGSMPEALKALWEHGGSEAGQAEPVSLEGSIASLLQLSAMLVGGSGPPTGEERRLCWQISTITVGETRPLLARVTHILDGEIDRSGSQAILFILAVTGLGIAAALVNFITIFRPLESAVMRSQEEIMAQRDKAIAADAAKRNFLSVVTHELRTPMNGVLGFASLLIASDMKPEHRKQVEIIQSSGKALLALVNDILDFSKMEAGSLELVNENFSIEEVITEVVTLLRGGAAEKQLEISVNVDARLPGKSRGDSNRLRQVLTNLVGNAIKFTDNGSIGVEAQAVSGVQDAMGGCELKLAIRDTGIGVPQDKREVIFERFTQIDRSARRKNEGTGLGLSICKQIVENMGGRIWVESTPGIGSTFFVRIPLAASVPGLAESNAAECDDAECDDGNMQPVAGNPANRDIQLADQDAGSGNDLGVAEGQAG